MDRERKFSRRDFLKGGGSLLLSLPLGACARKKSETSPVSSPTPTLKIVPVLPPSPSPIKESTPIPRPTPDIPPVVEETPQITPKESVSEYNLLSPEAFAPYASVGGPETSEEEILDFFPESYQNATDGLKGLWNRLVEAKLRDSPQTNTSLTVEMETLPDKISFDYLLTPEGTRFFDLQEQEERILPCESNVIIIGRVEGQENFLAIYQEPVNSCYYFTQVGKDILEEQRALAASKNLITKPFIPLLQNLKEIGTEEERKRFYEVRKGDSLATIARYFNLPSWHSLYGQNFEILRGHPELIMPDERLDIPNRFEEKDFVDWLTPDFKRFSLPLEIVQDKNTLYFPETGHYLTGEFLKFYQKWGKDVLGCPISEATPDGETQFFENMVLTYSRLDRYFYVPERVPNDGNWHIRPVPIGCLYYRSLYPEKEVLDNFPKMGEFELNEVFSDFYQQNGGLELLGFPVSEVIESDEGTKEQWLTNSCLRYNPKDGKIELAPLGKEYFERYYADRGYPWLFKPRAEEITVGRALEMVKEIPDKLSEIEARTVGLLLFWQGDLQSPERIEKKDNLIFEYLAKGEEKNFANAMAILAWHETRFEMNPLVEKALDRLTEGGRIINKLIQGKVPSEVFQDNKYPLLPDNWHGVFVFAGGTGLGGGLGWPDCPLIYGPYDKYQGNDPEDEEFVLKMLVGSGLHEAIHSFIQPASKIPHSKWLSEEKPSHPNLVPKDAREGLLAHISMDILTSAAQKHYGFKEAKDPRIDYILKVLKQGGVENPEAEVIRAAVTFNGKRLWEIYERVRKETDLSMDSLMSTQDDLALIQS